MAVLFVSVTVVEEAERMAIPLSSMVISTVVDEEKTPDLLAQTVYVVLGCATVGVPLIVQVPCVIISPGGRVGETSQLAFVTGPLFGTLPEPLPCKDTAVKLLGQWMNQ